MNERILTIDDEPWVHEVARGYLEREGFIVYSATTKRPALLVWDLMLPDTAGEEICAEVRSRSDVAVLMLTAKASEEQRVQGFELGADDYLTKPAPASWWRASARCSAQRRRTRRWWRS